MKLKLEAHKDIQILTASESITPADVQILKAGIGKLFRNGKNKIILELTDPKSLPNQVVREIAVLDIMARELSGRIVVAGVDAETKKKVELFAIPPVIPCYVTRQEAIQAFAPPPDASDRDAPPPSTHTDAEEPAVAPPQARKSPAAPGQTKEEIRAREINELGPLRKQVADLQKENDVLKEQLMVMVITRQELPDLDAYEEKVRSLEKQLETALSAPADKKAGKSP